MLLNDGVTYEKAPLVAAGVNEGGFPVDGSRTQVAALRRWPAVDPAVRPFRGRPVMIENKALRLDRGVSSCRASLGVASTGGERQHGFSRGSTILDGRREGVIPR